VIQNLKIRKKLMGDGRWWALLDTKRTFTCGGLAFSGRRPLQERTSSTLIESENSLWIKSTCSEPVIEQPIRGHCFILPMLRGPLIRWFVEIMGPGGQRGAGYFAVF